MPHAIPDLVAALASPRTLPACRSCIEPPTANYSLPTSVGNSQDLVLVDSTALNWGIQFDMLFIVSGVLKQRVEWLQHTVPIKISVVWVSVNSDTGPTIFFTESVPVIRSCCSKSGIICVSVVLMVGLSQWSSRHLHWLTASRWHPDGIQTRLCTCILCANMPLAPTWSERLILVSSATSLLKSELEPRPPQTF